jgi:N-acetylmuramoyl-L-alanine amidase
MFGPSTDRFLHWSSAVAVSIALFLGGCAETPGTHVPAGAGHFSVVLIDPGHGGKDSGGVSGRGVPIYLREKDLTLATAKLVRNELRSAGVRTFLTREDDRFIELDDRVRMADARGPGTVLISIHYDAISNRAMHGAKTFYWRADSHGLATRIQQHLVAATGEADIGVIRRRLRLTRNPDIPCVLCECAYITNPTEAERVATDGYRQRIAHGIAQGILEQYKLGDAGIAPVPEIYAPLSSAADKYVPRHHRVNQKHSHRQSSGS